MVVVVIHGNPTEVERSEGSFHPSNQDPLEKPEVQIIVQLAEVWAISKKDHHRVPHEYSHRLRGRMFHSGIPW